MRVKLFELLSHALSIRCGMVNRDTNMPAHTKTLSFGGDGLFDLNWFDVMIHR